MGLKKIEINGEKFEYDIFLGDDYHADFTEFYQGTEIESRKKYFFFGEIIDKEVPKLVFSVNFSIEDPDFTKEDVRKKLFRKVELLKRKEEIKKGEII